MPVPGRVTRAKDRFRAVDPHVRSVTVIDATEEDALLPSRNDETTRARVAGLCRNPALPESLVLRLVDHPAADIVSLMYHRRTWSDELFDVLAAHPNVTVRDQLAMSAGATTEQRVRLVDDPDSCVLMTLLEGLWTTSPEPLPAWAYRKLAAHPRVKRRLLIDHPMDIGPLSRLPWPMPRTKRSPPGRVPLDHGSRR
ncbi:hypothetical protein Asp14428_49450 [Actinoplanes sp. NBRC 14428]|nr:hypothetical protein Asp14428_49450 [Actinoplanes sp. NBRC 14428]